jgi:hypothetical protein
MRAGCIAQGIVGLGSFETRGGGLSRARRDFRPTARSAPGTLTLVLRAVSC